MENLEGKTIQWFPGHMKKAERLIQANLSLVDGVIEITDARIPLASRSVYLDKFINKPKLILLNKSDSADGKITSDWISFYSRQNINTLAISAKTGAGTEKILPFIREKVLKELIEKREKKGMTVPIRLMIVGIPNVGKSALINRLTKTSSAKVEDRPGVTRQKQWVKLAKDAELLDMPGILSPKYEDQFAAQKLALIGSVRDEVIDIEFLTYKLIELLTADYPGLLVARYKIEIAENDDSISIFKKIAAKRGMLIRGGEIDTERACIMLLDEFRGGKIGRISLERAAHIGL